MGPFNQFDHVRVRTNIYFDNIICCEQTNNLKYSFSLIIIKILNK